MIDYNSLVNFIPSETLKTFIETLPDKRKETVKQFLTGIAYKEIAFNLNVKYNTVKTHVRLFKLSLKKHYPNEYKLLINVLEVPKIKCCRKCGNIIPNYNMKFCNKTCANRYNRNIIKYERKPKQRNKTYFDIY